MPGPALDDPATSATSRYFFSFNCARCLFCARSLFPASLDRGGFRPSHHGDREGAREVTPTSSEAASTFAN